MHWGQFARRDSYIVVTSLWTFHIWAVLLAHNPSRKIAQASDTTLSLHQTANCCIEIRPQDRLGNPNKRSKYGISS